MRRVTGALTTAALLTGLLAFPGSAAAGTKPQPGRQTYTGVIDGAEFKVETPERWNGTLLIFSHPYYPAGMPVFPPGHGNRDLVQRPEHRPTLSRALWVAPPASAGREALAPRARASPTRGALPPAP